MSGAAGNYRIFLETVRSRMAAAGGQAGDPGALQVELLALLARQEGDVTFLGAATARPLAPLLAALADLVRLGLVQGDSGGLFRLTRAGAALPVPLHAPVHAP